MNRRAAIRLLPGFVAFPAADLLAQQATKVPVIGVPLITAGPNDGIMVALRRGLRERGYVDGENIRIEHRSAEGKIERLPVLAQELAQLEVDVFVAGAEPIARAMLQVTNTIPIVLVAWDYDPAASGLINSLNRPGGNLTGISTRTAETIGKRLELLRDLLPGLSNVAVVYDHFGKRQLGALDSAAAMLAIRLQRVDLSVSYDYQAAFKRAKLTRAQAAIIAFSPQFYVDRHKLTGAALAQRLPTMFQDYTSVRAGGLMSYGPDAEATWVRAGYFVDRILKGTKPSDLPVEEPKAYTMQVNLKTAKTIGVTIPQSILIRADEIIR